MQDTNSNSSPEDSSHITHHTSLNPSPEEVWEENHRKITETISAHVLTYEALPTHGEIAVATGLSVETVYDHLNDLGNHPLYKDGIEQFRLLQEKVWSKILGMAMEGDLKASKLYFQIMKKMDAQRQRALADLPTDEDDSSENEHSLAPTQAGSPITHHPSPEEWQETHHDLLETTYDLLQERHSMPTQGELAVAAGMSREAISRHLRKFTGDALYRQEIEKYRMMGKQLAVTIGNKALGGDMKAARLFLYLVTEIFPDPHSPKGLNNRLTDLLTSGMNV